MFFNVIAFALGDWSLTYFPKIPNLIFCGILLTIFSIATLLVWLLPGQLPCIALKILLMVDFGIFGFAYAAYHAQIWFKNKLEASSAGKVLSVTGVITGLPTEAQLYTRFLFTTRQFQFANERKRLQLIWEKPHPPLHPGELWQLNVRLKPPHSLVNFNTAARLRYWWNENIHGSGYVDSRYYFHKLNEELTLTNRLQRLRQNLQEEIHRVVKNPSHAAVISALTIGQEQGLSEEDWRVLQRTGTVHLVVIAGLHIGLMVMIAYYFVGGIWRIFPRLLRCWPAQKAGALAALIFAIMYGALAGFNLPAQRAVIMCIITMLGQIFDRSSPGYRKLFLALFLVLLVNPSAINTISFWLSFAAVFWIAYAIGQENAIPHWRKWLKIQFALFLGLGPLTIYYFQQFSIVSFLANPPAIMWMGWGVAPLCLLAALLSRFAVVSAEHLFAWAGYLLSPLWRFLHGLSTLPFAAGQRVCWAVWPLLIAELGLLWFLAPRKLTAQWLGLCGLIPIFLWHNPRPPPGVYWVSVLDVGQGLAIIVQTAHHLLVYDSGPRIPGGYDAGRDVVSPYLTWLGVNEIDKMIISHGDNDHSGGALALLTEWKVLELLTSVPAMFKNAHAQFCLAGMNWQWDGVPFRLLSPFKPGTYRGNNSSCVLQVGDDQQRMLLSGDIEKQAEAELVQQYGAELRSSILIAPHHGSKTSSTLEFLETVQPQQAIFSLGYFNRFHFPSPIVVRRYQAMEIDTWSTAENGALLIKATPKTGGFFISAANPHHFFWQN